jgi:hypothetical protein
MPPAPLVSRQQFTAITEQPGCGDRHFSRNSVTDEGSMRRMASNSPFFWL